jgi:hypothetical protein
VELYWTTVQEIRLITDKYLLFYCEFYTLTLNLTLLRTRSELTILLPRFHENFGPIVHVNIDIF